MKINKLYFCYKESQKKTLKIDGRIGKILTFATF